MRWAAVSCACVSGTGHFKTCASGRAQPGRKIKMNGKYPVAGAPRLPQRRPNITPVIERVTGPRLPITELEAAFGPAPLLKTEDPAAYKRLLDAIVGALQPYDVAEYTLARDVV